MLECYTELVRFETRRHSRQLSNEYKFEALSPDVIVMTHRATIKGTQAGKEITEHTAACTYFRSEAVNGKW